MTLPPFPTTQVPLEAQQANPQDSSGGSAALLDLALLLLGLVLVVGIADLGSQMAVSFHPSASQVRVDLHPALLPYYAARSCLRMFMGLGLSLLIAITLGSVTSRSPVAERLILPMVDVLQSVPVLGFLAVSVPFFLRLFPGSLLGLEAAALFAIVTSQVWNLIFCYHQSLNTIPAELREASHVIGLTGWQRLTRLELPASAIPLVWNSMMSFAGGWFFVTQSEAISVNNTDYVLPGLGSYVASAIAQQRLDQVVLALLTMLALIVLIDQLFWRPLVAWSEQFRLDPSPVATPTSSWFLDILSGSAGLRLLTRWLILATVGLRRRLNVWTKPPLESNSHRGMVFSPEVIDRAVLLAGGMALALLLQRCIQQVGIREVLTVVGLGFLTFARAMAVVGISTVLFLPLAATIGLRPRLASLLQPLILMLASLPANLLFPFFTVLFLTTGTPLWLGCVPLMAMGAQWYVLFNSTAGACAIPSDLREMAHVFQLSGWQKWRRFLLPAMFSTWITGAITACGAAWNASIVAELVTWGPQRLRTAGLGSYIADASAQGESSQLLLGLVVMALLVVSTNRLLWRPLYHYGAERYGA